MLIFTLRLVKPYGNQIMMLNVEKANPRENIAETAMLPEQPGGPRAPPPRPLSAHSGGLGPSRRQRPDSTGDVELTWRVF